MDFVTVRELRAESGKVWEKVEAGEEMVITRNGKPFAIVLGTSPEQLDQTLRAIRAARLQNALGDMHRRAREQGLDKLSMEDIDAEIAQARKERGERLAGSR